MTAHFSSWHGTYWQNVYICSVNYTQLALGFLCAGHRRGLEGRVKSIHGHYKVTHTLSCWRLSVLRTTFRLISADDDALGKCISKYAYHPSDGCLFVCLLGAPRERQIHIMWTTRREASFLAEVLPTPHLSVTLILWSCWVCWIQFARIYWNLLESIEFTRWHFVQNLLNVLQSIEWAPKWAIRSGPTSSSCRPLPFQMDLWIER